MPSGPGFMQITKEEISVRTVKLTVTCSTEDVKQGFQKAFKNLSKQIKVPGFRPGATPRAVLEKMIDSNAVREEAAEEIVRITLTQAIQDQQLDPEPTVRPSVDVKEISEENSTCVYEATVSERPVVELGDYNGLPVEGVAAEVSDEEVDAQIDDMRKRRATQEKVTDRGVEEGDLVVVALKPEGQDAKTFMIVIGKTFKELDGALVGMGVEQMKSISLTFPDDFQEVAWRGQTLKCQVSVNSISAMHLPALNDEFASKLSVESVEELKTAVRDYLMRAKENAGRELANEQLLDALMEKSKVAAPEAMADQLAYRRLQETEAEQREQGVNMQQYAEANGMTLEQLIEAWREKAKTHVARALLIRDIFAKEAMQIEPSDLNLELSTMSMEYGLPPKEVYDLLLRNKAVEELHFRAISRKVTDFLYDNADKSGAAEKPKAEPKPKKAKAAKSE